MNKSEITKATKGTRVERTRFEINNPETKAIAPIAVKFQPCGISLEKSPKTTSAVNIKKLRFINAILTDGPMKRNKINSLIRSM